MPTILLISFVVLLIDRISKGLIIGKLIYGQSIPLVRDCFHFTLVYNKGAAFGILQNATLFFIFISILSIGLILFFILFRPQKIESFGLKISLALILGGAVGNLIDRIRFGYVIDFLDFRIWPVFNLADSAITVGMIILAIQILRKPEKKVY